MSFDLKGYTPEAPKEGSDFAAFKYEGAATIEKAVISQSDKDTEFYPIGCNMIEIEATCMEDKPHKGQQTLGRKLWKRYNLDDERKDKKGKTPVMKLADQLFPLGVEFTTLDDLKLKVEQLPGMDIHVKAWPMDFKDGRDPVQGWNIKGTAKKPVQQGTQQVAF